MSAFFFITGAVAAVSAGLAIFQRNAIHALLYLIVSFIGLGFVYFLLGAPFAAVLEVIIYAGAIMVLFVFVVMMLNVKGMWYEEKDIFRIGAFIGPATLALILVIEILYVVWSAPQGTYPLTMVGPKKVSISLFGPYALAVELASMVLLAGLVGAYHLAHRIGPAPRKEESSHE
jgi:NADH-quinone oxidoreductase subunit J